VFLCLVASGRFVFAVSELGAGSLRFTLTPPPHLNDCVDCILLIRLSLVISPSVVPGDEPFLTFILFFPMSEVMLLLLLSTTTPPDDGALKFWCSHNFPPPQTFAGTSSHDSVSSSIFSTFFICASSTKPSSTLVVPLFPPISRILFFAPFSLLVIFPIKLTPGFQFFLQDPF